MAEDSDFLEEITDDSDEQLEYDLGSPGFNKSFIEIKRELLTCLNGIKITSLVAASKHYQYFINPGLMVADTLIPLPLTPRDAETIKNASRQAPFGRGDETVVDTSVRDTWELDHTQFKFANPRWNSFVDLLLLEVRRSLAIPKVKAEPYKLLLYEEGSFLKRHKDSEKVPGMVATMVICLPSKHEGGSVHLSHGSKNYIFDTSKTSEYDLTTLSWFSDVTHEVKPLESGYRLVLTYNIIHVGGIRMSADFVEGQSTKLRSILTKWHSITPNGFQGMNKLIYKLEHKYTESSLSLSNLKSRDHRVCEALYELGLEYGFTVFLAELNRMETEELNKYGDWDVYTSLDNVKTCDGQTICWMEVQEREILGKIWDRDPDSEDESEFYGNKSEPATLRYHDTVVIIVPTYQLCSRPLKKLRPPALISLVGQALDHRPDDHRQTTSLFDLLEGALKYSSIDSQFLSDAIALAIKYKQKLLYQSVVRLAVQRSLPQKAVLEKIVESIKARLNGDAIECPDWDYWFSDLFTEAAKQSLSTVQRAMDQIKWMLQEEDLGNVGSSFEVWISSILDNVMESRSEWDMKDCDFLKCHFISRASDGNWFISILSHRGTRELICEMLRVVYDERNANTLLSAKDTFQSILDASVNKLALKIEDFFTISQAGIFPAFGKSTIRKNTMDVIDQAFDIGLVEQATVLLDKTCTKIYQFCPKSSTKSAPDPLGIRDFLLCLATMLQKHQATPPGSMKDMFVVLLRNILVSNPPKHPVPLRRWARNPRPACCQSGPCADCNTLRRFLEDENLEETMFRLDQYRQRHLMDQLPRQLYDCRPEKHPPEITIRKIGNEYKEEMKTYETNLRSFEDHVRTLRCDCVKSLLGEELYNELVLLKDIPDTVGSMQTRRGEKRKPEEEGDGSSASRPQLIE
ncbi:hypothetical protein F4806DRAFT_459701 [Annulohypoxylon nitens]|nr:hypothetical protein F4806DRAFT_459701 [Annulohypoxylon nitens]